jgi:hypothetical protein
MSDIKEAVGVTIKAGVINVDDPEATQQLVNEQILTALGALKARQVTSAKLELKFKANIAG